MLAYHSDGISHSVLKSLSAIDRAIKVRYKFTLALIHQSNYIKGFNFSHTIYRKKKIFAISLSILHLYLNTRKNET